MEGTRIAEILSDEHHGHYAWEVEPFDPEAVLGAYISMADVECGQPLGVALVVLADGDSDAEIEWARSVADDIAGRLNEHAELATLAAQAERYRTALTNDLGPLVVRSAMVEAEHAALVSMVEKAASTLRELADLKGDELDIDPDAIRSMARRTLKAMREIGGFDG